MKNLGIFTNLIQLTNLVGKKIISNNDPNNHLTSIQIYGHLQ